MVSLFVLFWIFIFVFAIIGAMRGMAKELLVSFSIILALFIIFILDRYFPLMTNTSDTTRFWIQTATIGFLAFIGYEVPRLSAFTGPKFMRQTIQDVLLGFIIGAINGYGIVGSIWYYMNEIDYFPPYITEPGPGSLGDMARTLVEYMPPPHLIPPWLYVAVALAFLVVLWLFV